MAEIAYQHEIVKFADGGLNLNVPPDLVPPSQYARLSNALSHIEGQLQTREGTSLVCNGFGPLTSSVHTIFRLNQIVPSTIGARLFGIGNQLWAAPLPAGNAPSQLATYLVAGTSYPAFPVAFGNSPFSIASFRFDADPQIWAIIASSGKMMKYKAGYFEQLGLPAPTDVATASAGSSGNLTGTYDWRYTYWNSVTQSESNPSPTMNSTPATTISPSNFINPNGPIAAYTGYAPAAFANPANAYDGNPATYAQGIANQGASASCSWAGWTNAGAPYASLVLNVTTDAVATASNSTDTEILVEYSLDGGVTWNRIFLIKMNNGVVSRSQTDSVSLPPATDLTKLVVGAVCYATFNGVTSASNANLKVNEIIVDAQPAGGGSGAISLTAQSAVVCVTPPTDPQEDSINLYRRGGTLVDNWWFVGQYQQGTDLTLTQATVSGGNVVYSYSSFTGPAPTVGMTVIITGFSTSGNNLTAAITALGSGTFTVVNGSGGNETHAGRAQSSGGYFSPGSCGPGTAEIDDNASDASIEANNTLDLDNFMPVDSVQTMNQTLQAIWTYQGRVLGCGDPNRPEAVYFSKVGNADEWPAENWIQVSDGGDEMMNGIVFATRCFAFSRELMYTLIPNLVQGVTFSPFDTACRKGLKGRFALARGEKGIYFVSKDGIYRTSGGAEESITTAAIQPIFPTQDGPGIDVNGVLAPNLDNEDALRLAYHNGEIWFDYIAQTDGSSQTLVYDERRNRWRRWLSATASPVMHYSEPDTDSSLLSGLLNEVDLGGGPADPSGNILVEALTGSYDQGAPLNLKQYGNVILDLDPGGATVTVTPYINAGAVPETAVTVTGSGRQRVAIPLADFFGLNLSFDFAWTAGTAMQPVLYQMDILWRLEPSALRHWEVPPVALGQSGWWFARDGYVTLRSAANVTMTVTPDNGPVQFITLPATGGAKSKLYFSLAANKQKVCQFSFDSAGDFRLYADENELRCRQWVSKLGYQVIPLFGAESGGGAG